MDAPFLIFGAGGHGKVVLDGALAAGMRVAMLVDEKPPAPEIFGVPVVESFDLTRFRFLIAIGNNQVRARVFGSLQTRGGEAVNVIHPSAVVSTRARLGVGVFICAGAIINADALIGDNCIINTGASVDHDCVIGPHTHLAPGVRLAGNVRIGAQSLIGLGTVALPGIEIGEGCVVGAGSVVNRNLPANVVAFGGPARIHKNAS